MLLRAVHPSAGFGSDAVHDLSAFVDHTGNFTKLSCVSQNLLAYFERRYRNTSIFTLNERRRGHAGAARGRTASKDERAAHTVIFDIRKVGHTLELGDRRRPQVVGALDNVRDVSGYFIFVFLC